MNKVILMGRLTRDPVISTTAAGLTIARFSLAVDRRYKTEGGDSADFPSCVAFGKTAEFIEKYLKQGTKIALEGHIQTGSYDKDGVKHYTTDVIAEAVEFAESKKAEGPSLAADSNGFIEMATIDDGDLPF